MWPVLLAGVLALALGVRHALEPDHLAAVSTLVAGGGGGRQALATGAVWGLGHSLALLALGALLLGLRARLPVRVENGLEAMVGLMLLALGARALTRRSAEPHAHARRPLAVGLLHGVAGSGALTALAIAALPSLWAQLWFMLWFGVGAMAGMALCAGLAGFALRRASALQALLAPAAGLLSMAIGAWKLVTCLK
jgi:high-affinity nickel permease